MYSREVEGSCVNVYFFLYMAVGRVFLHLSSCMFMDNCMGTYTACLSASLGVCISGINYLRISDHGQELSTRASEQLKL